MQWTGKHVTILGAARSGLAAALYLKQAGADVLVSDLSSLALDKDAKLLDLQSRGVKFEVGEHSDKAIKEADLIVTSPGIKPESEVMLKSKKFQKEVISDLELVYRDFQIPIVAVTGTNGKSTTTALISHILEESGKKAPACGNIGVPILTEAKDNPDYLVVEISSFQITYSPTIAPDIAIWLNLTPDHLDWHGDLDSYTKAKQKLFAQQKSNQFAILNIDDPVVAKTQTKAKVFPFSVINEIREGNGAFISNNRLTYRIDGKVNTLCEPEELKIIGKHNLENVLAAISAAALLGLSAKEIEEHIKSFTALEHRLEFVDTINGVAFYNDSKATNTASAIKALEAFGDEKVVLIAGGKDKGTDLLEFVQKAAQHTSAIILIGEATERFYKAFADEGIKNLHKAKTMEEAVDLGCRLKEGPVVLSPACASFDMFRDYEDRGRVFKDIVRARLAIKATH